jgi:surfactin synthase thioesterase subunit
MLGKALFMRRIEDDADKVLRVLVVPHAGSGGASAKGFMAAAPPHWLVCAARLPGRESRTREPVPGFLGQVTELARAIRSVPGEAPLLLVGSCSGAALALEAARMVESDRAGSVAGMVVLSRRAPNQTAVSLALESAEQVFALVQQSGGFSALDLTDPEVLEVVLPLLISDIQAVDGYTSEPWPQLAGGILTLAGESDLGCPSEVMLPWSHYAARTRHLRLPVGHLMLISNPTMVVQAITDNLDLFGAG